MWLVPTFVTAATFGSAIRESAESSPGRSIPISSTSTSSPGDADRIVSGTPTRLLWFPSVACVRLHVDSAAASIDLVVVLPTDPVTATTTHPGLRRRHSPARAMRNACASSPAARRTAHPVSAAASSSSADGSLVIATQDAPARMAPAA